MSLLAEPDKFRMTYTMTAWDYAAMTRAVMRRTLLHRLLLLGGGLFVIWFMVATSTGYYDPTLLAWGIYESGSTGWLLFMMLIIVGLAFFSHWVGWAISFLYYRQIASAGVTITMGLRDTGITGESSIADTQVPWKTVKRVICEKNYLFLPLSKREAFILPKRGFSSSAEFTDACHYAVGRLSMAHAA